MFTKIGITMRVVNAVDYDEPRDAISHDWIDYFNDNNFDIVLIPNCGDMVVEFLDKSQVETVILSNGDDVCVTNDELSFANTSQRRDYTERRIIDWSRTNNIKILGVCRGFQLLNYYFGGTIERVNSDDHVAKIHNVNIIDKMTRETFDSDSIIANSFHNKGVLRSGLAPGLIPFATANDGNVEGFFVEGSPILGIQWHPERLIQDNILNSMLPTNFIKKGPWWL
jgi:N5-(cytidine 5'-diphosphoramidyl)-L-glutamine hydrolase